ncbi:hypothetical protein BREVNS_1519 [Brevinematales bacterium NS]|nr:hypothetical protein BREVNS_1519 [Brevinematales bacterium NS]
MSKHLLILFLTGFSLLYGWRAWHVIDTGADTTGIGQAYVVSIDTPSFDIQPASTGFVSRPLLTWDLSTSLTLVDPLSGRYQLAPDPLLSLSFSIGNSFSGVGFSLRRIIGSVGSDLAVYRTGVSGSWLLLPNLRVGGFLGGLIGKEYTSYGTGLAFSLGSLYQLSETWRLGVSWQTFSPLSWSSSLYGKEVQERFPSRLAVGFASRFAVGEWFAEIDYTDTASMGFLSDGITENLPVSELTPWTIHLGWRSKLPLWDIPFHLGLFTDHLWTSPRPLRQWSLALGIRAVGKNVRLAFTWVDNYLFSLFLSDVQPTERGLVSLSYLF